MSHIVARAPGSCGELVQGVIDDTSFHVSCPVAVYSYVVGRAESGGRRWRLGEKARLAATKALGRAGYRGRMVFDAVGGPPRGIGMASSTADVSAAVAAAFAAAGVQATERQIATMAVAVEPSDGIMFSGIVAFDHKRGRYVCRLGPAPNLYVTYFDTGGTIDTVEFNREKILYTRSQRARIRRAFDMAAVGIDRQDSELVGAAATLSARVNQEILPKPGLEELIELSSSREGYGVVVAHSGTVMGVLHDQPSAVFAVPMALMGNGNAETVRMIGGGCRVWAL